MGGGLVSEPDAATGSTATEASDGVGTAETGVLLGAGGVRVGAAVETGVATAVGGVVGATATAVQLGEGTAERVGVAVGAWVEAPPVGSREQPRPPSGWARVRPKASASPL